MNKPTRTPKQAALAAISALPDAASFEEIAYRLQVLEAAAAGTAEIEAGKGIPHGDVEAEILHELDRHHLRGLLLDGLASGPGVVADDALFAALRNEARDTGPA